VRLRISLSDRPGALAGVAAVIAGVGGNITAIDVLQSGDGQVVDDVVVDLPDGTDMQGLRRDLASSGAGTMLSHQASQAVDPVVAALNRAVEVIQASDPADDAELVRSVSAVCSSPAVWVERSADGGPGTHDLFAIGVPSGQAHGSYTRRSADLPPELAERLPGETWVLSVPDPDDPTGRVVYVARSLDAEFTSTEVARVEAVIALHNAITRR
jgi:hypothetical protein